MSTDTVDLDALLADARAQAAAGNTEAALDTVRACVERGLDVEGWIKAGQVADDCGDLDLAESCWRALETLEPWEPEWLLRQADVAVERTEYDHACRLVATAKERWPNHPMVQSHSLRYSGLYGRSNSNMFDAEEIAADATTRPPAALDAARWLVGAGMTEPARPVLSRLAALDDDRDIRSAAEAELKALDILEQAGPQYASVVPGFLGRGRNVVFQRGHGSDTAVVVFTGLGGRCGTSVNVFHSIMAPLGIHAIYLFDEERLLHMNGNVVLGQGYEATVQALRKTLHAWKARRVVCIGVSGGGYAAIRYGIDLGAERVAGFGAPTTLERDFIWKMGAGRAVIKRLERYIPEAMVDVRPLLDAAPLPPRVDLYCGETMGRDRAYADHLMGLPNVYVYCYPDYDGHDISAQLLRTDQLAPILRELCGQD